MGSHNRGLLIEMARDDTSFRRYQPALDVLVSVYKIASKSGIWSYNSTAYAYLTVLDCGTVAASAWQDGLGPLGWLTGLLIDVTSYLIQNKISQGNPLPVQTRQACCSAIKNIVNPILPVSPGGSSSSPPSTNPAYPQTGCQCGGFTGT
jgi:hypothetical protein